LSGAISSRWVGRNRAEDIVREKIWRGLVENGGNVGSTFHRISNFVGADKTAKLLSALEEWKRARRQMQS
jgi:hypothetical protein